MAKQFWVKTSKGVQGPFSGQQIKSFYETGKLKGDHEISPDQEHWQSLGKVMSLPSNAGAATEPPAAKSRPEGAKKKKSKVIENIEDFEEDDDEIEDYDDDGDEWGGMGSYGAPLPSPGTRGQKQGGGGSLQNTRVGLQVFQYSWLCLTIVVYLWINLFGVMYVTTRVGMSLFDPFDRDGMSPKTAMGIGYFVALLVLAALFGLTCLAKRGVPIYAAIIAFVCLLFGAGIFVESREFRQNMGSAVEWCGLATKVLTYTSMVAILIGWFLTLSAPAKFRLTSIIGLISIPVIALAFWQADEAADGRLSSKTAVAWLALGANVGVPVCMLASIKLCDGIGSHKGNKRVPKDAHSAWILTWIAFGVSLLFVAIALMLPDITLITHGIWFLLVPPLAAVFSAIVLIDLLADTHDLV